MYFLDVYFKNKIRENYSNRDKFNKIFKGVDLINLNYIRKSLNEGDRCLLIFEKDIVGNTQPNILLGSPLLINLLFLYLKNISMNNQEDNIKRNQIKENFDKLINIYNLNYNYYQYKYPNHIKLSTLTIQNKFENFFKRILFQVMINFELYKNRYEGPYLKLHKDFLFTKIKYLDVNQIILNEISEMKKNYREKLKIKTYTDLKDLHVSGDEGSNVILHIFDKIKNKTKTIVCEEFVLFNTVSKRNLKISSMENLNEEDNYLNKRCYLNLNWRGSDNRSDSEINFFELKYITPEKRKMMETFSFKKLFDDFIMDNKVTGNKCYLKKVDEVEENVQPNYNSDHISKIGSYSTLLKKKFLHRVKYLQMKIKKFNNLIGEEIFKNSLNINESNTSSIIRMNENQNIQKITNLNLDEFFVSLHSNLIKNNELDQYIEFTTNLNNSSKFERKSLEIILDEFKMFFQDIDKEKIRNLILHYNVDETRKILRQNSKIIGGSILQSQIEYEINHIFLKTPFDFLIKRHDFLSNLSEPTINLFSILSPFAEKFNFSSSKINEEILKLLLLKFINYH